MKRKLKNDLQEVAKHFGYELNELASLCSYQYNPNEAFVKMTRLSEIINLKKKTRVVFDYDPDYPQVLIQFFEK